MWQRCLESMVYFLLQGQMNREDVMRLRFDLCLCQHLGVWLFLLHMQQQWMLVFGPTAQRGHNTSLPTFLLQMWNHRCQHCNRVHHGRWHLVFIVRIAVIVIVLHVLKAVTKEVEGVVTILIVAFPLTSTRLDSTMWQSAVVPEKRFGSRKFVFLGNLVSAVEEALVFIGCRLYSCFNFEVNIIRNHSFLPVLWIWPMQFAGFILIVTAFASHASSVAHHLKKTPLQVHATMIVSSLILSECTAIIVQSLAMLNRRLKANWISKSFVGVPVGKSTSRRC